MGGQFLVSVAFFEFHTSPFRLDRRPEDRGSQGESIPHEHIATFVRVYTLRQRTAARALNSRYEKYQIEFLHRVKIQWVMKKRSDRTIFVLVFPVAGFEFSRIESRENNFHG